jgi:hypothetical protein
MLNKCPYNHRAARWIVAALVAINTTAGMEGANTKKVAIDIHGPCPAPPPIIGVVRDGDEGEQFEATWQEKLKLWVGEWRPGEDKKTFDATGASVSLRLKGARTGCLKSTAAADKEEPGGTWAFVSFGCNDLRARNVTIDGIVPAPVSYVRQLEKRDKDTEACLEWGILDTHHTVNDVRFPDEFLFLKLRGLKNARLPALLINHPAVIKDAEKPGDKTATLDQKTILRALRVQRSQTRAGASPSLSSNSSTNDVLNLSDPDLKALKVVITVH